MSNQFITSSLDGISVSIEQATTITARTLTINTANTETSHSFLANVKGFEIKSRQRAELKFSFTSGDIALGTYVTIPRDTEWSTGVAMKIASGTIYLTSDTNNTTVEIVEYT